MHRRDSCLVRAKNERDPEPRNLCNIEDLIEKQLTAHLAVSLHADPVVCGKE